MPSKKLEIIYYNGQPDGIRSIRKHLSTMTTYVIPRPLFTEAKKITGINRPGIYYLINESDDNKIAQIYIGQTRNGVIRLDDHNRSKDFWNKAIKDRLKSLEKLAEIVYFDGTEYSQLKDAVGDADGVIVNKSRVDAALMDACPNLKYVGTFATGYNNVDVMAAKARNIVVCNVPDYSSDAVAQHAMGFILMTASDE